jgi:hypothetical protein
MTNDLPTVVLVQTLVLPSGHLPILSHPGQVADFVYEALTDLSRAG